jgi:hypothetical protein
MTGQQVGAAGLPAKRSARYGMASCDPNAMAVTCSPTGISTLVTEGSDAARALRSAGGTGPETTEGEGSRLDVLVKCQ